MITQSYLKAQNSSTFAWQLQLILLYWEHVTVQQEVAQSMWATPKKNLSRLKKYSNPLHTYKIMNNMN
jgi:hypothetical protein